MNKNKNSNDMKYTLFEINERLQNGDTTSEQAKKELLILFNVSNRRELLIDFFRKVSKVRLEDKGNMYTVTEAVDEYLKDN